MKNCCMKGVEYSQRWDVSTRNTLIELIFSPSFVLHKSGRISSKCVLMLYRFKIIIASVSFHRLNVIIRLSYTSYRSKICSQTNFDAI